MARHTHHCDSCADLVSSILRDSKADYIANSTLARLLEVTNPCYDCQEHLISMQSRLTGRIYEQQLPDYFTRLQEDSFNNIKDLFD